MTDDLECVDFAPPRSPATLEHDGGRFFDDDSQDFANFVGDGDDEDEDDVFDTVFSAQTRMRARALERIELLACKFAQDALRAGDGASGGNARRARRSPLEIESALRERGGDR